MTYVVAIIFFQHLLLVSFLLSLLLRFLNDGLSVLLELLRVALATTLTLVFLHQIPHVTDGHTYVLRLQ